MQMNGSLSEHSSQPGLLSIIRVRAVIKASELLQALPSQCSPWHTSWLARHLTHADRNAAIMWQHLCHISLYSSMRRLTVIPMGLSCVMHTFNSAAFTNLCLQTTLMTKTGIVPCAASATIEEFSDFTIIIFYVTVIYS